MTRQIEYATVKKVAYDGVGFMYLDGGITLRKDVESSTPRLVVEKGGEMLDQFGPGYNVNDGCTWDCSAIAEAIGLNWNRYNGILLPAVGKRYLEIKSYPSGPTGRGTSFLSKILDRKGTLVCNCGSGYDDYQLALVGAARKLLEHRDDIGEDGVAVFDNGLERHGPCINGRVVSWSEIEGMVHSRNFYSKGLVLMDRHLGRIARRDSDSDRMAWTDGVQEVLCDQALTNAVRVARVLYFKVAEQEYRACVERDWDKVWVWKIELPTKKFGCEERTFVGVDHLSSVGQVFPDRCAEIRPAIRSALVNQ